MPFIKQPTLFYILGFGIFTIYFLNLFIDVMDIDAAQYASISLEMIHKNSYLQVFHRNMDYLDKPPMLFWLASASFNIFGVANWSFKLPAVFIIISGLYATFRLGKLLYNQQVGLYAAFVLATSQAFFLITNDVRTDGILTGFCILAIWQYIQYDHNKSKLSFVMSAIFLACALMSKGPIALIIFLAAVGTDLLIKQNWNGIFKITWLYYFVMVGVLLLPMCYGLYQQFDLHPEKVVYDLAGPSGLKFFFWTQSFGRITGDIYWQNDTSYFFFFHTILWDFQPWALLFVISLILKISRIKSAFLKQNNEEFISLGGFIFPFIALSLSKFKLPHYIFPLFPFAAIITAHFLVDFVEKLRFKKAITYIQFGLMHIFFLALVISYFYFFNINNPLGPLVLLIGFCLMYFIFLQKTYSASVKILFVGIISSIAFNFNMSTYFYPQLLNYQTETAIGKEIMVGKINGNNFYTFKNFSHSLDFYSNKINENLNENNIKNIPKGSIVFTDQAGKNIIFDRLKQPFKIVKTFDNYPVTRLNINFLKETTRANKIDHTYLLEKY